MPSETSRTLADRMRAQRCPLTPSGLRKFQSQENLTPLQSGTPIQIKADELPVIFQAIFNEKRYITEKDVVDHAYVQNLANQLLNEQRGIPQMYEELFSSNQENEENVKKLNQVLDVILERREEFSDAEKKHLEQLIAKHGSPELRKLERPIQEKQIFELSELYLSTESELLQSFLEKFILLENAMVQCIQSKIKKTGVISIENKLFEECARALKNCHWKRFGQKQYSKEENQGIEEFINSSLAYNQKVNIQTLVDIFKPVYKNVYQQEMGDRLDLGVVSQPKIVKLNDSRYQDEITVKFKSTMRDLLFGELSIKCKEFQLHRPCYLLPSGEIMNENTITRHAESLKNVEPVLLPQGKLYLDQIKINALHWFLKTELRCLKNGNNGLLDYYHSDEEFVHSFYMLVLYNLPKVKKEPLSAQQEEELQNLFTILEKLQIARKNLDIYERILKPLVSTKSMLEKLSVTEKSPTGKWLLELTNYLLSLIMKIENENSFFNQSFAYLDSEAITQADELLNKFFEFKRPQFEDPQEPEEVESNSLKGWIGKYLSVDSDWIKTNVYTESRLDVLKQKIFEVYSDQPILLNMVLRAHKQLSKYSKRRLINEGPFEFNFILVLSKGKVDIKKIRFDLLAPQLKQPGVTSAENYIEQYCTKQIKEKLVMWYQSLPSAKKQILELDKDRSAIFHQVERQIYDIIWKHPDRGFLTLYYPIQENKGADFSNHQKENQSQNHNELLIEEPIVRVDQIQVTAKDDRRFCPIKVKSGKIQIHPTSGSVQLMKNTRLLPFEWLGYLMIVRDYLIQTRKKWDK